MHFVLRMQLLSGCFTCSVIRYFFTYLYPSIDDSQGSLDVNFPPTDKYVCIMRWFSAQNSSTSRILNYQVTYLRNLLMFFDFPSENLSSGIHEFLRLEDKKFGKFGRRKYARSLRFQGVIQE